MDHGVGWGGVAFFLLKFLNRQAIADFLTRALIKESPGFYYIEYLKRPQFTVPIMMLNWLSIPSKYLLK